MQLIWKRPFDLESCSSGCQSLFSGLSSQFRPDVLLQESSEISTSIFCASEIDLERHVFRLCRILSLSFQSKSYQEHQEIDHLQSEWQDTVN